MKLTKIMYSKIMLKEDSTVNKSYVTSVQNNKFHEITITPFEIRKSVKKFPIFKNKRFDLGVIKYEKY